jgi:hypothetical protein
MYEGWTRLLIVFLTHPGVLVPIPAEGLWTWARGLWQASWVMILHSFSENSKWKQLAEMSYWLFLFVMVYIQVAIAMADIKT